MIEEFHQKKFSRQQIRRFKRKISEATEPEHLQQSAARIAPEFGRLVAEAKDERKWNLQWKEALFIAAAVITVLQGAPAALRNSQEAAQWVAARMQQWSQNPDIDEEPRNEAEGKEKRKDKKTESNSSRNSQDPAQEPWPQLTDL